MVVVSISLPRLVFGSGSLSTLSGELALLGVSRALLLSDRGLERAGTTATVSAAAHEITARFLEVPENPTAAGADAAMHAYAEGRCDGVVALGGGSVLDTGKIVAAMAGGGLTRAADLLGSPERISRVVPLIAIPTTVGTGSESSPVAALHVEVSGPAVGTRHQLLVPRIALCDPDLTRTLPKRLIAATAIDALSHCIEGFLADPENPTVDALALDGVARVVADVHSALTPEGDSARASLMAAAFAGGAAIHKGLGPAHAIALVCGEQGVHHGTLIGVALPHTTRLLTRHVPEKAARLAAAVGVSGDLGDILENLIRSLDLPTTLAACGFRSTDDDALVGAMVRSHFNRTSPYAPNADEYRAILDQITG